MNKTIILMACLLAAAAGSAAQAGSSVSWENRPRVHEVPAAYSKESAVFVLEKRHIVYRTEMDKTYVYRTVHRIIKVLDDKGIEGFNRITILSGGDRRIDHIQARTVVPGGKVYEVGMEEMKETRSEEGIPQYIFAMKGLEPGAEVELLYTEKKALSLFGSERFQSSIPVLKAEFTLIAPERLQFETKGYNGFPNAADTIADKKRRYHVTVTDIPPLKEEQYSNHEAALQRIDYRIGYLPEEKPDIRQFTWNDLAKQLYNEYYAFTDKEKKAVARYLQEIGITGKETEEQKVRIIEDAVKSHITVRDDLPDESYGECNRIIEKKMATESGQARLFTACFTLAGVRHEFGLSSNRFNYPLDEQFESWKGLEFFVFYFPRQQQYLFPTGTSYRMPVVPLALLGNKGVFCKLTAAGNLTTAVAAIRTITPLPADRSDHRTEAAVHFSESLVPEVELAHAFTGYAAIGIREALVYLPREKEKELVTQIMDIAATPEDILEYKVKGKAFANYHENKPLTLTAKIQAPGLMDKAGSKYLFRAGELIGRQAEMYQEEKRKLAIDVGFPHMLSRTLSIAIPKGYKITNPDALVISKVYKDKDGNRTLAFISEYKKEDNTLIVNIQEVYGQLHYPASEIGRFREVINAAADFNKIVLVMERE